MGSLSWSHKAASNLRAIHEYIVQDSESVFYATRFIRALIKATRKLESFPDCGRLVPEFEGLGLREVIHKGYRIIYRLKGPSRQVEILAVVRGTRDLKQSLQKDWEL